MTIQPIPPTTGHLPVAQDFYGLRREGIGYLQQAGSDHWTDYNTHDPGISILEALAYAITDLAYRTGFPIEDLLATAAVGASAADPYPDQAFPSARRILTVNPTINEDFRRLLIDVDQVRNAWVRCRTCACASHLFSWCEENTTVISDDPGKRIDPKTPLRPITVRGLYDVQLELEADSALGDLNDRTIVRRRSVEADGQLRPLTVELHFPAWPPARRDERHVLASDTKPLNSVTIHGPNNTTTGTTPITDSELRMHWFEVLYVDLSVELADGTTVPIQNASLRLFGDGAVRRQTSVGALVEWLGDETAEGFVEPYRRKLTLADDAVRAARDVLESHRNLDEDYCHLGLVEIDDVAVCADIEVEASADIEWVQARIWFEIERYLDPPVDFWSLEELRVAGEPVEAIFNGPELDNGFLTADGLAASDLRTELRVSDIIDRLSDIGGVVSVSNLLLSGYDSTGNPIPGIADPTWVEVPPNSSNEVPRFDAGLVSAQWLLYPPPGHRTRLHRALSRFRFTSHGLPFMPRLDEAEQTLVQLRGEAARPKLRATELDLAMPLGRTRALESYQPIQHTFPMTYGIGPAGLPSTATPARRAQASQLKGYLMVYEQLLRNGYAQLAHATDLFSLDPAVTHTYFTGALDASTISGYDDLVDNALATALPGLVESSTEYLQRRNVFLDHLLARFGESFGDYAMALSDLQGQSRARTDLIHDKVAFLRALPRLGHDRGKALNRAVSPCDPDNASGLQQRVTLLLGLPDWTLTYRAEKMAAPPGFRHTLTADERDLPVVAFVLPAAVEAALTALIAVHQLDTVVSDWSMLSTAGRIELLTVAAGRTETVQMARSDAEADALLKALDLLQRGLLAQLVLPEHYTVTGADGAWGLAIAGTDGNAIGSSVATVATRRLAEELVAVLSTWAAHKRAVVVEHLLLRPKFPGDALYPSCTDEAGCEGCGDDSDPYSFRLTYVIPGWTEPFSTNLTMRAYADRTIQEQTPSHLLVKTCWMGNDGYLTDPCDPMIDRVAAVLADAVGNAEDACACAAEVYSAFGDVFGSWLAAHPLVDSPSDVLAITLDGMFESLLMEHFVEIARRGHQFERFEHAWCSWADAEAAMDWTAEQLAETVIELLGAAAPSADPDALCRCAAGILAAFGTSFRDWMLSNIAAGRAPETFTKFVPPVPAPCQGHDFGDDVAAALNDLLCRRYAAYTEVSYRLHLLLRRLVDLRNTYPRATLHDCDAGSDFNPVRLGQTALGSN